MNIKLADIGSFLRNSLIAMLKGEFLLRLNAGKYFLHIIFTFILFAVIILVSLMTESTMAKVESNKKIIKELEILHSQREYELARCCRRSEVTLNLAKLQSKVQPSTAPATILTSQSSRLSSK